MNRWLLVPLGFFALVGACDRSEREVTPFQPSDVTVGSGSQNEVTSTGGGGGAGGEGGAGGSGGAGSFCDGPGVFCQECTACMIGGDCALPLNDCEGQLECGLALDCLRSCRDGCFADPTCLGGCHDSCSLSSPGYGAALGVLDCFCRDGCPTACASALASECLVHLP